MIFVSDIQKVTLLETILVTTNFKGQQAEKYIQDIPQRQLYQQLRYKFDEAHFV